MKKLITLLIILTLATGGIFASPDAFLEFSTLVDQIQGMKITASQFTGTSLEALANAEEVTSYTVTSGGSFEVGWISVISNNRTGYEVTMSATAMASTETPVSYINYTISLGTAMITTNGATPVSLQPPSYVFKVASLDSLTPNSRKITLIVSDDALNSAVEGQYTGTVTFSFTAT
ncbi:MAG: hypothetical protein GX911_06580 [Spirochaetales bacterium]|nr:hypothetical protein [Spirochaetales bacterium]